jgi:hypothetical protein
MARLLASEQAVPAAISFDETGWLLLTFGSQTMRLWNHDVERIRNLTSQPENFAVLFHKERCALRLQDLSAGVNPIFYLSETFSSCITT